MKLNRTALYFKNSHYKLQSMKTNGCGGGGSSVKGRVTRHKTVPNITTPIISAMQSLVTSSNNLVTAIRTDRCEKRPPTVAKKVLLLLTMLADLTSA